MPLMFSPSNHYDRSVLMTAVTARVPPRLVVDNTKSPYAHVPMGYEAGDRFSPCGQSLVWGGPRIPRIAKAPPRRRSRWGRVLRDIVRFVLSPRAR